MFISTSIRTTAAALLVSSAAVFAPTAVFAFDPENLIKRYQALAAKQGQTFSYSSIENTGGNSFVAKDPSWGITKAFEIKAKTLTFTDIEEGENGGLSIKSLSAESITSGSPEITFTFEYAKMKDLWLPGTDETDPIKSVMYYKRFEMGKSVVSTGGKPIVTIGNTYIDVSPYDVTTPMKIVSKITDIKVDTSAVPEEKFKKMVADMGYGEKFTGHILMDVTWALASGDMDVHKYDIVIEDVGTLSIPFSIGGYTAEKMQQIQKMNETSKGMSEQEQGLAAIAAFADITLRSASISFKDDSVTKRGLNFASKQMGQPPEQLATMAPMMVGIGMGQLQMPELTKMVSEAIAAFLANPGTFSISVKPEKPVPVMSLAAAGTSDPKALVKMLNLQITAN